MTPEIRRDYGNKRHEVAHIIRYELRRRGYPLTRVAEELKLSVPAVSRVVRGFGHSKDILVKMREIGVPEKYLFDPNREDAGDRVGHKKAVA